MKTLCFILSEMGYSYADIARFLKLGSKELARYYVKSLHKVIEDKSINNN